MLDSYALVRFVVLVTCAAVLPRCVCVCGAAKGQNRHWNSLAADAAADTLVAPRATNLTGISLTFFPRVSSSVRSVLLGASWSKFGVELLCSCPPTTAGLEISPFLNSTPHRTRILLQPPPSKQSLPQCCSSCLHRRVTPQHIHCADHKLLIHYYSWPINIARTPPSIQQLFTFTLHRFACTLAPDGHSRLATLPSSVCWKGNETQHPTMRSH